jgi:hypothetical protein
MQITAFNDKPSPVQLIYRSEGENYVANGYDNMHFESAVVQPGESFEIPFPANLLEMHVLSETLPA